MGGNSLCENSLYFDFFTRGPSVRLRSAVRNWQHVYECRKQYGNGIETVTRQLDDRANQLAFDGLLKIILTTVALVL
jgi:hypothetical protein